MTVAIHAVKEAALDAAVGGYTFLVNCEKCGGGLVPEACSRGREDIATACRSVSAVVFCPSCRVQARIDVVYTPLNQQRTPESRWTP